MRQRSTAKPDTAAERLGPFWLSRGITRWQALTLLYGGFSSICMFTFLSFGQPYVLEAVLEVPKARQGALTGLLGTLQEAVLLLLVGLVGAWSDHVGRRLLYVAGVLVMAAAFLLYPLAGTETELIAFRIVYTLGFTAASVMMHTCFAEYSQDATRGRWMGTVGFFNGLGAVVTALVLAKLPLYFGSLGYDSVMAIRLSFWVLAAYLGLLGLLLYLGLQARPLQPRPPREPLLKLATKGLVLARGNPPLALAYGMAFASRGDLAVLTAFMSLWLVQAGTDAGLSPAQATAKAGMLFGLAQGVGLLWAFVMGLLLDRIPRLTGVVIAFALASIGYLALGAVTDPFGPWMIPAAVLVGIGEGSAMVSSAVLIGQEAPARIRGAALGASSLAGGAGFMILTFSGGQLFDLVGRTAPFTMMGLVNLAVFLAAVAVRRRQRTVQRLAEASAAGP